MIYFWSVIKASAARSAWIWTVQQPPTHLSAHVSGHTGNGLKKRPSSEQEIELSTSCLGPVGIMPPGMRKYISAEKLFLDLLGPLQKLCPYFALDWTWAGNTHVYRVANKSHIVHHAAILKGRKLKLGMDPHRETYQLLNISLAESFNRPLSSSLDCNHTDRFSKCFISWSRHATIQQMWYGLERLIKLKSWNLVPWALLDGTPSRLGKTVQLTRAPFLADIQGISIHSSKECQLSRDSGA